MNKIKSLRLKITMIYCYVVEYQFHGVLESVIKRQRFSSTSEGYSLARKNYQAEVKYIEWEKSEDFEMVELKAITTNNGEVWKFHYDSIKGNLVNRNYSDMILNCDG